MMPGARGQAGQDALDIVRGLEHEVRINEVVNLGWSK